MQIVKKQFLNIVVIPFCVLLIYYLLLWVCAGLSGTIVGQVEHNLPNDHIQYPNGTLVMWNDCESIGISTNLERSWNGIFRLITPGSCKKLATKIINQDKSGDIYRLGSAESIYYTFFLHFFSLKASMDFLRFFVITCTALFVIVLWKNFGYLTAGIFIISVFPIYKSMLLFWGSASFVFPFVVTLFVSTFILQKERNNYDILMASLGAIIALLNFPFWITFCLSFCLILIFLKSSRANKFRLKNTVSTMANCSAIYLSAFFVVFIIRIY